MLLNPLIILEFNTPYLSELSEYVRDVAKYNGYSKPVLNLLWTRFTNQVNNKEEVRKKEVDQEKASEQAPESEDKNKEQKSKNFTSSFNKYSNDDTFNKDELLRNNNDLLRDNINSIESEKRDIKKTTIGKLRIFRINFRNRKIANKAKNKAIDFLKTNTLPIKKDKLKQIKNK